MSANTVLIFDAKCPLCTDLATKIHSIAKRPIEIRALTDPRAIEMLTEHYPSGWEHDFYLIENGTVRKGVRSLNKMRKHVGSRQLTALIGEYSTAKINASRMSLPHDHVNGERVTTGRRNMLKGAVLAAAAVPLAGIPRVAGAFEQPRASYAINFVEGKASGGDGVTLNAWANNSALRQVERFDTPRSTARGTVTRQDAQTLKDVVVPRLGAVRVDSASIHKEVDDQQRSMITYNAALDAERYHISMYAGYGDLETPDGLIKGATLAVGIRHDLAAPVADVTSLADGSSHTLGQHLSTYRASLSELRQLHARQGRPEFTALYTEIERGFARLMEEFAAVAPGNYRPLKNRMIVSATPEILKFVEYPATFASAIPMGCDCSCSCGACCAIGCGIGFCVPPKPCGPGCCISCGCGCGCCL